MKILVIGKGGREHALAYACKRSALCDELICAPGNPGMAKIGECIDVKDNDVDGLVPLAVREDRGGRSLLRKGPGDRSSAGRLQPRTAPQVERGIRG